MLNTFYKETVCLEAGSLWQIAIFQAYYKQTQIYI